MTSLNPGISFNAWPRRLRQAIIFLMVCLFVTCVALVFGCWSDDRAINANRGEAIASVRAVEVLRTTVDFVDEQGQYQSPPTGLRYPVGLEEGQRVHVEYDRSNPETVRVAGRGWTLAIIPALSVLVAGFIVAAPLWWLSVRASRRRGEVPTDLPSDRRVSTQHVSTREIAGEAAGEATERADEATEKASKSSVNKETQRSRKASPESTSELREG